MNPCYKACMLLLFVATLYDDALGMLFASQCSLRLLLPYQYACLRIRIRMQVSCINLTSAGSLQDAHRQRTIDWIDATGGCSAAFDFTTKGVLQEAVAQNQYWRLRDAAGKPPGVLGWWPSHAVTFVEVRCSTDTIWGI